MKLIGYSLYSIPNHAQVVLCLSFLDPIELWLVGVLACILWSFVPSKTGGAYFYTVPTMAPNLKDWGWRRKYGVQPPIEVVWGTQTEAS